jgi:hypothetical protein
MKRRQLRNDNGHGVAVLARLMSCRAERHQPSPRTRIVFAILILCKKLQPIFWSVGITQLF